MEDQKALQQTAALHFSMLRCEGKLERMLKHAYKHAQSSKTGLLGSAPIFPLNCDDMFSFGCLMHWPTFSCEPWHTSLLTAHRTLHSNSHNAIYILVCQEKNVPINTLYFKPTMQIYYFLLCQSHFAV